jgi:hypothetical protein
MFDSDARGIGPADPGQSRRANRGTVVGGEGMRREERRDGGKQGQPECHGAALGFLFLCAF